jgi:hypothetical protein
MAAKTKSPSMPPRADDEPANRTVSGQFRKGFSGNPTGRPKSKPFRDALEAVLKEAGSQEDLLAIARALCGQALAGNVQGIREVADRLDGKVPQAIAGIDEDEHLTPLAAVINLRRTQPQSPSKAVGGIRKPGDGDPVRRSGRLLRFNTPARASRGHRHDLQSAARESRRRLPVRCYHFATATAL